MKQMTLRQTKKLLTETLDEAEAAIRAKRRPEFERLSAYSSSLGQKLGTDRTGQRLFANYRQAVAAKDAAYKKLEAHVEKLNEQREESKETFKQKLSAWSAEIQTQITNLFVDGAVDGLDKPELKQRLKGLLDDIRNGVKTHRKR